MNYKKSFCLVVMILSFLLTSLVPIAAKPSYFQIKDGVLVKYTGPGGNVIIPDGVKSLGRHAFNHKIKKITIPNSVTTIEEFAFYGCGSLESIFIPENVSSIGDAAFIACSLLTNVTVSKLNKNYTSINGILLNKNLTSIIRYPPMKNGEKYNIPETAVEIKKYAFDDCINLTSIFIPDSVNNIGAGAFSCCYYITSIRLPNKITKISDSMFVGCINLEKITIPNSVTSIETSAFESCEKLQKIKIPEGVTSIPDGAFAYCENLSEINISKGVKTIGYSAFFQCLKLKNITIPGANTILCEEAIGYQTTKSGHILIPDITICGYKNSTAHDYALINKIKFKELSEIG